MPKYRPHRISHDHKYNSGGDFERKAERKGGGGVFSDDGSDTLVNSSKGSHFGSKRSSKGKLGPAKLGKNDDYIPKSVLITDWIKEQRPKRRLRWWILLFVVILLMVIIIPVVVIKVQSGSGIASEPANSTATVFVSLGLTTTATATTTASATTFITTQISGSIGVIISPTITPSSSTSPSGLPTPVIPNEGFHAKSFQNGDLQIIYADGQGNIKSIQRISGSWSNPAVIATDAATGTTVSASTIYYHDVEDDDTDVNCMDYVDWTVYYVDKNHILQALYLTINFDPRDDDYCSNTEAMELSALSGTASGYSWTVGSLGSFQYKVGRSLYHSACTYNQSLTYSSDTGIVNYPPSNVATVYIYYDSDGGNIVKVGAFPKNNGWEIVSDIPSLLTMNNRAVECTTRTDGIESVWVATQNGTIQQWWTNINAPAYGKGANQSGLWNLGLTYNGSVHANTSVHGLSTPTVTTVYFQAANNSIMQLSFTSSAGLASSPSFTVSEVAVGNPGTKLATSGGEIATDSFFYLYFQNGTSLAQMYMQRDSATGQVSGGGTSGLPTMGAITIPTVSFYAGAGRMDVQRVLAVLCFVGVGYLWL